MAADEALLERVREVVHGRDNVVEKSMFGGKGIMVNGHLTCGVRDRLMLRIGEDAADAAHDNPHVEPMVHGGRRMKDYVYVNRGALEADGAVAEWVGKALDFVDT